MSKSIKIASKLKQSIIYKWFSFISYDGPSNYCCFHPLFFNSIIIAKALEECL